MYWLIGKRKIQQRILNIIRPNNSTLFSTSGRKVVTAVCNDNRYSIFPSVITRKENSVVRKYYPTVERKQYLPIYFLDIS